MKRMLKLAIVWLIVVALAAVAHAEPLKDYEDAQDIYDSALACMAAYSNRLGSIGISRLEQEGWKVQYFDIKKDLADAKFLLMERTNPVSGQVTVLLAVAGTETEKDIKSDLRFGRVNFAGSNFAEFEAKALVKEIDDKLPTVHRGFNQVTQTALTADILQGQGEMYIAGHLLAHPEHKLIVAGHSLGGAVATIYGARLLSMGVHPEQVKVITFGAPAVGNKAFAAVFQDKLNLTRIVMSGDVVTSVLQDLVGGGYIQFGNKLNWVAPNNIVIHPHHIPVYVNIAAKDFYQKRLQAVQAGTIMIPLQTAQPSGTKVYVAPVNNRLRPELQEEFSCMKEELLDEYRTVFPSYIFGQGNDDLNTSFAKAAAAGCDWLVVADIEGHPSKTEEGVFFISLQQSAYSVKDKRLVNIYSSSDSTERSTPIVAFINGIRKARADNFTSFLGEKRLEKPAGNH